LGLFVQTSFKSLSIFFSSVERIWTGDSSSTKDMDSLVISGGMLAADVVMCVVKDQQFEGEMYIFLVHNYQRVQERAASNFKPISLLSWPLRHVRSDDTGLVGIFDLVLL